MTTSNPPRRRGTVKLSELVGKLLEPVSARRGIAAADLIASWRDIVGARFADCSRPEKIVWPKGPHSEGKPALLVLRVDGPKAILLQHESGQIVERVNAFLGYGAIGQVRIVQAPVTTHSEREAPAPLSEEAEADLGRTIAAVEDDRLRAALDRLGRGVLSEGPPTGAEKPGRPAENGGRLVKP